MSGVSSEDSSGQVRGLMVDCETRCVHYGSDRDVVAIRFFCCGDWYACYSCHAALANHRAETWPRDRFNEKAVLCGVCRYEMTIHTYLQSGDKCVQCGAAFNPNCRLHHHLYFQSADAR